MSASSFVRVQSRDAAAQEPPVADLRHAASFRASPCPRAQSGARARRGWSVGETLQLVVDVGSAPEGARTLGRAGGRHQCGGDGACLVRAQGGLWRRERNRCARDIDSHPSDCQAGVQERHAVTSARTSPPVASGFG